MKWLRHWLDLSSRAIEDVLARQPRTGHFCCGDRPTIADISLGQKIETVENAVSFLFLA